VHVPVKSAQVAVAVEAVLALQHVSFKQVLLSPVHFIFEFAEFAIKSDGHKKSAQVALAVEASLALQHVSFKQVLLSPLHFILEFAEFGIKSDGHVKLAQVAGRAHLQPASLPQAPIEVLPLHKAALNSKGAPHFMPE
jgi:hypothetical protein